MSVTLEWSDDSNYMYQGFRKNVIKNNNGYLDIRLFKGYLQTDMWQIEFITADKSSSNKFQEIVDIFAKILYNMGDSTIYTSYDDVTIAKNKVDVVIERVHKLMYFV